MAARSPRANRGASSWPPTLHAPCARSSGARRSSDMRLVPAARRLPTACPLRHGTAMRMCSMTLGPSAFCSVLLPLSKSAFKSPEDELHFPTPLECASDVRPEMKRRLRESVVFQEVIDPDALEDEHVLLEEASVTIQFHDSGHRSCCC